ncbi:MAG: acyl-CoA dehydrogenase [Acidimicrobiales bacterium]|jgi:alkylation response protein AidB-like acyl-CoA dehydrogenase
MPIPLSGEHRELRNSVAKWLGVHSGREVARSLLDADVEELRPVWSAMADEGWLGIHLPEADGGQGFGLFEAAVILEETGWAVTPGPLLTTVAVSALAARCLPADEARRVLPGLADGTTPAALYVGEQCLEVVDRGADGEWTVSGTLRPVLGLGTGSLALVPVGDGAASVTWCLVDVGADDPARAVALASTDATRRVGQLEADRVTVPRDRRLSGIGARRVEEVVLALLAAEHAGGARWCLETATEYAKVRVQFGRPIGQFQAVKHRAADMAVRVEQMAAVAWDAVQAVDAALATDVADDDGTALATSTAAVLALDGYVTCAEDCLQILGGIGFTWEHDVHLHLKRALADRQLVGGSDRFRLQLAEAAGRGARRALSADLPDEAERWRAELAPVVAELVAAEPTGRRRKLVDAGLVSPHWPAPWGRDAGAVEQVVIDEELAAAGVDRPHLGVGAWVLPVLISCATPEQQERWVRPTLLGEMMWCQLFSEPGAGSDLASLSMRAERVRGGWELTGQKVWTSMAHVSDWGICLARTDPGAPKHEGITYFVVDMRSPGLEVRPLRELTGAALFNEVFFDSVHVPDDCVVGEVDRGWGIARMTLANERVSISSGATFGTGVESLVRMAARQEAGVPIGTSLRLGGLLAEAQSLRLMAHRSALLSLAGSDPGPAASLRKLLGAEHEQRVQELGLVMTGPEGAVTEAWAGRWSQGTLATRCLTIAGGTSEVQRNVIGERILGLPRDAEPEA